MGKKGHSSMLRKPLKPKVARKKYRGYRKKKAMVMEKEVKWLEEKAAEMRSELKHMKWAVCKYKAKLRKLQQINSETREANRKAYINNVRTQFCIHAILRLFD